MDNPQDTRPQGYTAAPSTPGASAYQDARSNEHPPYQQATAYDPTEQYHPYTLQNPNPPGLYYLPSQQNPGAPYHSPVSGNLGTYYQGTAQSPQNMYYATDPRNFGSVPGYAGHAVFPQVPGAQYVPQYGVVPQIHGTGTPQIIGDATHPAHMQMQGAPYRIAASQNQGALRYVDPQGVRASHHGITLRDTPATYYGSTTPQTSGVPMYTAPPYAQANAPQLSSSFQSVPGPGVFIFYRTQRLAFTTTSGKLLNPSSTKHICLIHDIHDDSDGHKSAWIVPITSGSRSGNGVIKRNSEFSG
ncbi:hypothetical protein OBBRIDRAFT_624982 [Obba rivulosa]|uniref:Uncharacterized protein n=1 Tax=Obba rivulosa TaxID=1052685 RepID=A0A8E2DNK4_9APHY|nr:hypothetical protein OBBRIDRAFT_624982 [Obba rivulosa]